MALPDFTFQSRTEYLSDLTERFSHCGKGDHITLMSMVFNPSVPMIQAMFSELCAAASRGAAVTFITDGMTFTLAHGGKPGPLFFGNKPSARALKPYDETYRQLEKLQKAGGQFFIVNQAARAFANPYARRSHIKLALINDRVYIPTCNFDNQDNLDVIVSWQDGKTANWLSDIAQAIARCGNVREALQDNDITKKLHESMTLYIDCGVPKRSTIFEAALRNIDHASAVFLTCQYFPGGRTGQHLAAALRRGASVEAFYGHIRSHGLQTPGHWLYKLREQTRLPRSLFARGMKRYDIKLHAKVLVTDDTAMIGSHNFVTMGVNLGTAELALEVRHQAFSQALIAKTRQVLEPVA